MYMGAFCLGLLAFPSLAWISLGHLRTKLFEQVGLASWYGPWHHSKKTANGQFFSRFLLAVAHRTLPSDIMVWVTNLSNGKDVVVKISGLGQYVRPGILDLSEAAAR